VVAGTNVMAVQQMLGHSFTNTNTKLTKPCVNRCQCWRRSAPRHPSTTRLTRRGEAQIAKVEPARYPAPALANTDLRRRWLFMRFKTRTGYKLGGWAGAALLGLMILVTGCSSDSGSTAAGSASSTFNEADVKFAQTMIPHNEQAVEMADAISGKQGVPPEITQLAQQIKDAQVPEVEALRGFLAGWEQPLIPDHSSEAHQDRWAAEGDLTPEEMQALKAADAGKGQRLFLRGMIKHHKGAIAMVQEEIDNGENPDAVKLAEGIKDSQSAQIKTMETLLARL
jgi:uncharacterized protein (DUF305 family)